MKNTDTHNRTKQTILGVVLSLFIFVQMFGLLLFPRPVHAQFATAEVSSVPNEINNVLENIGEALYTSALGALIQGASYFMRQLAFDTASYIASGGKGQGALAFREGPGPYFEKLGKDTAAEAIDQFGKSFGLDLCSSPDLGFNISLKIGLRRLYSDGPRPNCSWQELSQNWEAGIDNDFGLASAANFADSLSVEQSDFGIALGAIARVDNLRVETKFAGELERIIGRDFKPVTDLISGEVRTPAAVIEEETKALTANKQSDRTLDQINGIYGAGAAQILPLAASVFLNTLTTKLLDQVLQDGIFPRTAGGGGGALDFFASTVVNNRQAAQKAFNFLFTAVPSKSENVYDIIAEFSACPRNPGINNCVVDGDFRQILQRASVGRPMTIQEAMAEGLLHENWPLVSPRRTADNTDITNCYLNKYCYSNLQKLRKVRILPLGFEIAALRADPDTPWTLGQVVAGFEDCTRSEDGTAVIPDPEKPFCHLIDPNWIIRSPEARCEARVFGPELLSENAPQRREECVDASTCITEGSSGECLDNYYSYCTKEKNVWRFGESVATCEPQYATCTTYAKNDGTIASYLSRTLDFGECRIDSVGCRAYSLEQADGEWVASASVDPNFNYTRSGRTQVIYFNEHINLQGAGCPANAEGCTGFYTAEKVADGTYQSTDTLIHLKKAPGYLGCYDIDRATIPIDWPQTEQQVNNLLPGADVCGNFARVCVESEVGCQGYTPVDGIGPEVPGVVGNNICAAECVGYDAFQQEASTFDPEAYPLYFIPSRAVANMESAGQVCSEQYAGCSEFTNLDTVEAGGEGLEYYTRIKYCEKPDVQNGEVQNIKTFYTWEGSASEGFVLRVHELKPVDQADALYVSALAIAYQNGDSNATVFPIGSPMYADDSADRIQSYYDACNKTTYEASIQNPAENPTVPDCRAFYDTSNIVSYRLLSKTITVDEACHPLRKTESGLFADTALDGNPSLCEEKGGLYEGGSCQRCYGGGAYIEVNGQGSCVYQAITQENQSTSCLPEANGCRAYTGNAGGNILTVFLDTFEPFDVGDEDALNQAKAGWPSAASIVAESTFVSQYSLQLNQASAAREMNPEDLESGAWYELTFWARGASGNLRIAFEQNGTRWDFTTDSVTGQESLLSIGDTWQQYTVGPVQFTGDADTPTNLVFERTLSGGGGPYFLDNVELTRVQDHIYLVKNSWKEFVLSENNEFVLADAPLACDSAPSDGFPGEALGCRAYTDRDSQTVNATGFDKLCREEAIGCTPVIDTYNTVDVNDPEVLHAYNVKCTVPGGVAVTAETTCVIADDDDWSCTVIPGKNSCYVEEVTAADAAELEAYDNASIDEATVIVSADTLENDPIFLTNTPATQCNAQYRGCQRVGLEDQVLPDADAASYEHSDVLVLNNPERYTGDTGILCRPDLVGCEEFHAGDTTTYFKDPLLTGGQLCEYRKDVDTPNGTISGWFLGGVGRCGGTETGVLCRADSDCAENVACQDIGTVACYPDYVTTENEYGLWSNGTAEYDGFVGTCPIEQNACSELVDPADTTSANPDGTPYYVIFDDEVQDRIRTCDGRVNLEEGCVLFDKTDVPNKLYNSASTYAASDVEIKNGEDGFVNPVATAANDSNIILKVDRDRECSEWLACRTALPQQNARGGVDNVCYEFRACNETDGSGCTNWVPRDAVQNTFLSYQAYIGRDTSWYGEEYTGYSLFDRYLVNNYIYVTLGEDPDPSASYVAYQVPQTFFDQAGTDGFGASCGLADGFKEDWTVCGFDGGGRCIDGGCIYPIDGTFPAEATADNVAAGIAALGGGGICKAFPEPNSPFPRTLALNPAPPGPADPITDRQDFIERKPLFTGANICQDGNCSCEYTKVQYKNGTTDFWSQALLGSNVSLPPQGICVGGEVGGVSRDGVSCSSDANCGTGGTCSKIGKLETHLGLKGYCLEYDYSRPINGNPDEFACLTWLPIDVSASNVDNFNLDQGAGFSPVEDVSTAGVGAFGGLYCVNATQTGSPYDGKEWDPLVDASAVTYAFSHNIWNCYVRAMLSDTLAPECNGDFPFQVDTVNFYSILQSWLHELNGSPVGSVERTFGPNALVLRAEQSMTRIQKVGEFNGVGGDTYGGHTQAEAMGLNQNVVKRRGKDIVPYNLLPRVFTFGIPKYGCGGVDMEYCEEVDQAWQTIGTVHHPPRKWDENEYNGSNAEFETYWADVTDVPTVDQSWKVSGLANAPGPRYEFDNMDSALYRSPFEASMTEADLDKVFFVPIAYPGGQQEQNPVWLDDQIYLDFPYLDSNLIDDRIVGTYSDADSEKGGPCAKGVPFVDPNSTNPEGTCGILQSARVLTYKLDRSTYANLIDSSHYPGIRTGLSTLNDVSNERNVVDRRYVLLWYQNSKITNPTLQWIGQTDSIGIPTTDPFSEDVHCIQSLGSKWFVLAMDFNSDGEFLGYVSRWCSANEEDDEDANPVPDEITENGVNLAVVATLNNTCTEYHLVQDETNVRDTNKAWTNRLWDGSQNGPTLPFFDRTDPIVPYAATDLDTGPFGAINRQNILQLRSYSFPKEEGGVYPLGQPYACDAPLQSGFVSSNIFGFATCPAGSTPRDTAVDQILRDLFAKSYIVAKRDSEWEGNISNWLSNGSFGGAEDAGETAGPDLLPPQIYSLNPATCFGEGSCTAGEANNITVNGRNGTLADYNGNQLPDEDGNLDGTPDALIAKGSLAGVVQFFAFADDNRMPIKRVMVDWDDGSITNQNKFGKYKNRKPFCESSNNPEQPTVGLCGANTVDAPTLLTCASHDDCPADTGGQCVLASGGEGTIPAPTTDFGDRDQFDLPRFGNLPRACTEGYFEFQHGYSCETDFNERTTIGAALAEGRITQDDAFRLGAQGLGDNNEICVFVPRVQVLDNWGWCNGTNANGHYGDTCDLFNLDMIWTSFQGKIIIIP